MKVEEIISDVVKPLVISGTYKDETTALKDIVITHIERKIENYNKIIQILQKKYDKDFGTFTKNIKNKATPVIEDDWMEWQGAIEMKNAWKETLKEVLDVETKV